MADALHLETARLRLRPATPADRADLVALEADPEVMRFLNGGRPVPEAGDPTGSFLTPRGGEAGVWTATLRDDGTFVGWFSLRSCGDGAAELGYRLRRVLWGQGYATEGAQALVAAGLGHLGYERVRAETMAVNLASRRVLERAGLRHVSTLVVDWPNPLPGSERGEVIYEVERPQPSRNLSPSIPGLRPR